MKLWSRYKKLKEKVTAVIIDEPETLKTNKLKSFKEALLFFHPFLFFTPI